MLDNTGLYTKALLTSLFTAISIRLEALGSLLWIFIAAIILDYITGMMAAVYNKELNSNTGFRGVIRKVGKCFIIAVALLSDEVVSQSANQIGVSFSTGGVIASIVTVWLILNELISVLENIAKMNIDLPPFLLKAITLLKNQAQSAGEKLSPEDSK